MYFVRVHSITLLHTFVYICEYGRSSFSLLNLGSCPIYKTRDLSQAEKKMNDVTSWANAQNKIYFTQNGGSCHFE